MSPYVACYEHYKSRGWDSAFMSVVSQYLQFGVVHVTDRVFVAGRRVRHDAPQAEILDPTRAFGADADTWLLAAFWGDASELWRLETPLQFVAWQKLRLWDADGNTLHIYPTSVLSRFIQAA